MGSLFVSNVLHFWWWYTVLLVFMGVYWNLVFDGVKLLFGGLAWPLQPSNLVCTFALPRTTPLPPYSCYQAGTETENFSDTFNISVCFFPAGCANFFQHTGNLFISSEFTQFQRKLQFIANSFDLRFSTVQFFNFLCYSFGLKFLAAQYFMIFPSLGWNPCLST